MFQNSNGKFNGIATPTSTSGTPPFTTPLTNMTTTRNYSEVAVPCFPALLAEVDQQEGLLASTSYLTRSTASTVTTDFKQSSRYGQAEKSTEITLAFVAISTTHKQ